MCQESRLEQGAFSLTQQCWLDHYYFSMPIRKSSSNAEKKQRATSDMSATLKAESQKAKFSVSSESKPHQSDNLDNHQAQAEDELLAQPEAVASKVSNLNIEQGVRVLPAPESAKDTDDAPLLLRSPSDLPQTDES